MKTEQFEEEIEVTASEPHFKKVTQDETAIDFEVMQQDMLGDDHSSLRFIDDQSLAKSVARSLSLGLKHRLLILVLGISVYCLQGVHFHRQYPNVDKRNQRKVNYRSNCEMLMLIILMFNFY